MAKLPKTTGSTRRRMMAIAASCAAAPLAARASSGPIVLGQVQLSFYAVTGGVVHEVLERLGHAVEVRSGPHEMMFPLLGAGEIDLMAAVWLPEAHGAYWARYGGQALEVAALYDGARFFLGVPDYVPASQVATIADLAKPEVAARMEKIVQAIGPGATITTVAGQAMEAYDLSRLGYVVRPGTAQTWTSAYDQAVSSGRWIVFPSWTPQYLNRDGKIRPLSDPKSVLGGANRAVLVAPQARFAALPVRTQAVLGRIRLSLEAVTEMDWFCNARKMTPREAARTWIAGQETEVARWLAA